MGENREKQQICVIRPLFPSNHFWQGEIDHFSYSVTPDIHLKGISHFYEFMEKQNFYAYFGSIHPKSYRLSP